MEEIDDAMDTGGVEDGRAHRMVSRSAEEVGVGAERDENEPEVPARDEDGPTTTGSDQRWRVSEEPTMTIAGSVL